ncbi:MAG: type II secretion system protein M [Oricola sp.]|jgi:general secretion pathway protein M|nr:type II secretion system protein M [Oricola sp.]
MTGWWQDLSPRERVLVMIAGALACVLLVSLGVVRPLAEWRASTARSAQSARDAYELTLAAAAVAGGAEDQAPQTQTPARDALIRTTAAAGIQLVRLGTENNNQIEVQIEPVSGDVLFAWLAELENRYGLTIAFADLSRGQAGVVTPQILVFERR